MHNGTSANALALAKLSESGLDWEDAQSLGIEVLEASEIAALCATFLALPALKLNYYDVKQQPLVTHPGDDPFYRIRYLAQPTGFGSGKKVPKYVQEPDTGCAAYFPTTVDWEDAAQQPSLDVIITEGELKAACAAKHGYATIGLGGVYSFKMTKELVPFLPELVAFPWRRRRVYICYDSDFRHNTQVCKALNELAHTLMQQGARPYMVCLPDVYSDGRKTGLDDFLVAAPDEFPTLLQHAHSLTVAQRLWEYNKRFVYVYDPGLIVDQRTGRKINPGAFRANQFAQEDPPERVDKANGAVSMKLTSCAVTWIKWQQRFNADKMTYAPGEERLTNQRGSLCYNTWPGWGCEPTEGDVRPFFDLLDYLFTDTEAGAKEWFIKWLAYPLQYPGTKLFTSCVLHGIHQGTGKSLLGYTMGRIYGHNFTEITQQHLHSTFNEWAENKQFILADDITGSNRRQDADMLKKMITQKELRVNTKFIPSYVVPDCVNYLFTTNRIDAFFMEDSDRRFFIHEITVDKQPEEFYAEYDLWLHGHGPSHLFYHLLHDVDLSDFNPAGQAYYTLAKERMILDVKSDLEMWVLRLKADPDSLLRLGDVRLTSDLYTNSQLRTIYDPEHRDTNLTANAMGRALRRSGFKPLGGDTKLYQGPDGPDRFYCVRNYDTWKFANTESIVNHIKENYRIKKNAKF